MTLSDMQAQLDALLAARFRGVRSTNYDGKSVTYGSDAEMARAIADLEARIAAYSVENLRNQKYEIFRLKRI